MRIVIGGGTGFLGGALTAALRADGHDVLVLTRQTGTLPPGLASWTPDGTARAWARVVDGADAVINLAGVPLDEKRWTEPRKRVLVESRVLATRSLARAIAAAGRPPALFLSSSAVGYYGPRGEEPVTESDAAGADAAAVPPWPWRTVRQWPPVHVVDSPAGLDRPRAMAADQRRARSDQRDRPRAGNQRGVRGHPWAGAAPPPPAASAGLRPAPRARRDGRCRAAGWPARRACLRTSARLPIRLAGARGRAAGSAPAVNPRPDYTMWGRPSGLLALIDLQG